MEEYRYSLETGIKKYNCPSCLEEKKFRRYIDIAIGEYIADDVGICDRKNNCGYHFTPKAYFELNPNRRNINKVNWKPNPVQVIIRPIDQLPIELVEISVSQHEKCNLFPYLEKLFRKKAAKFICEKYLIGSNNDGNTVFWQASISGEIRQAKVVEYDSNNGKRNKATGVLFAGKKILENYEANLLQCFFGEYLLALPENKGKIVAIVESEKTAAIASIYYPDFVWLATGGSNGCRWTEWKVCNVLNGRKVILFPDLGQYNYWSERAKILAKVADCIVVVSDELENNADESDKKDGLDIEDFLLRVKDSSGLALTDHRYPVIWDMK
jgi:hypothetical protein